MNREQIQSAVVDIVERANKRFRVNRPVPVVRFFQKSRVAGRCWLQLHLVEFNETLAQQNPGTFMETIIHEIAHLFTHFLYPDAKQAHGPEFRAICKAMGGTGRTYHDYDTSAVSRKNKIQQHIYKCPCGEHRLSTAMHNRILRGSRIGCRSCKNQVSYVKSIALTR